MATNTPTARARRELIDIDPTTLGIDEQVRSDATPDEGLLASIRSYGIQQPPTVYWDTHRNQHVIITGHRRVGAAITLRLPTIEVIVGARPDGAALVGQQLVENERRLQLNAADIAKGFQAQELFGRTPSEIADSLGEKPERVNAALKAVASTGGTTALAEGIDLMQAALIADFDDDPTTQEVLLQTAIVQPADFNRRVAQAAEQRLIATRIDELKAQLAEEGCELVQIVRWSDTWWTGNGLGRTLAYLEIPVDEHKTCPGHGALIHCASDLEDVAILYVCTQCALHATTDTDDDLLAERAADRQRREAELAARAEHEASLKTNATVRREWLRSFITGRLNQTPGIFDLIASMTIGSATLEESQMDAIGIAVHILTGSDDPSDDTRLAEMLARGEVTALRALVAYALATGEYHATATWGPRSAPRTIADYYMRLMTWGYQLTEIDKAQLALATEAIAAQTPEDPTDGIDDNDAEDDA